MKFYKIAFILACFNKGYGVTAPLKVVAMSMGVAVAMSSNILDTALFGIGYMLFCLILGYILYRIHYVDAETEVSNKYNPFAKEVRKKLKVKSI